MKQCAICNKTEYQQGSSFDCEIWKPTEDKKVILLCDDCFFNDAQEKNLKQQKGN